VDSYNELRMAKYVWMRCYKSSWV